MKLYLRNWMHLESIKIRRYCAQSLSVGYSAYRCLRKVFCEKRLLRVAPSCLLVRLHVCPSVHVERLDFHMTAVCEILHWKLLRKRVKAFQFCFKPNKNNRHFTWRLKHIYAMSMTQLQEVCYYDREICRRARNILIQSYGKMQYNNIKPGNL
jgi:hypothetical protein